MLVASFIQQVNISVAWDLGSIKNKRHELFRLYLPQIGQQGKLMCGFWRLESEEAASEKLGGPHSLWAPRWICDERALILSSDGEKGKGQTG